MKIFNETVVVWTLITVLGVAATLTLVEIIKLWLN